MKTTKQLLNESDRDLQKLRTALNEGAIDMDYYHDKVLSAAAKKTRAYGDLIQDVDSQLTRDLYNTYLKIWNADTKAATDEQFDTHIDCLERIIAFGKADAQALPVIKDLQKQTDKLSKAK